MSLLMNDSNISQNAKQNEAGRRTSGKIFKGTINDAPMKVRVASIPCKFQNVIYRSSKTSAFGNSKNRFYSDVQNENQQKPGPGDYENFNKSQQKIFSKKGYGSLVSNTKLERMERQYSGLPGPGAYNPEVKLLSKTKRSNSLALLSSKIQGHQLFKSQLKKSERMPGPGLYNVKLYRSNSQAQPFANNLSRFEDSIHHNQSPGVGHYVYESSSLKKTLSKSPSVQYKKSGPQINDINYQQKLKIVRQVLGNKNAVMIDHDKNVGPGSYNINLSDKKIAFKIPETNYDRFGQIVSKKIRVNQRTEQKTSEPEISMQTGDEVFNETFHMKNTNKISKGLTSMFKSNLARYDFVHSNANDPGRYSPGKSDRKSHLINFDKKWV